MNFNVELLQDFNLDNPNQGTLDPRFNETVANLIRLLTTSKTRYGAVYTFNYPITQTNLQNHSNWGTITTDNTLKDVTLLTEVFSTVADTLVAPYFNAFDISKDIPATLDVLYAKLYHNKSRKNRTEEQFQLLKHDIASATYLDMTHFINGTFTTYGYFALVNDKDKPDKKYLGIIYPESNTLSLLSLVPLSRYLKFNDYRWLDESGIDPNSPYWNEADTTDLHQNSLSKFDDEERKRISLTKPTPVSRSFFLEKPRRGTYFWLEDALDIVELSMGYPIEDLSELIAL